MRAWPTCPQRPIFIGETLHEAILLPFSFKARSARSEGSHVRASRPDDDALRRALGYAGLNGVELDHDSQELSVGQQARVCLIRTLLTAPDVLLADEADAALDAGSAEKVGGMLASAAAGGTAVLRVRHHEPDGLASRALVIAAVQIALAKGSGVPLVIWPQALLTVAVSVLLEIIVITELVVRPTPWYAPEVLVTMAGMLLGNVVTAVAIALTRFFRDMRQRRGEVEMMLALGATPAEAAKPSIVDAVKLGLLPTVSQLASSGLVLIPGMMAGQIIAGADPILAAKYQFVVLAAISALTVIGDVIVLALIYRTVFTRDDQLNM